MNLVKKRGGKSTSRAVVELLSLLFLFLLLLSSLVLATHTPITVRVQPQQEEPLYVGQDIDFDVLLNVPDTVAPSDATLYYAQLKFKKGPNNFEFDPLLGSASTDITTFNPLEQNRFLTVANAWVMEGDGGGINSFPLTTTPVRLGTIPLRITAAGALNLILDTNVKSRYLVQQPGATSSLDHLYSVTYDAPTNIEFHENTCGNSLVGPGESCSTCPSDVPCAAGRACSATEAEANPEATCVPICGDEVCLQPAETFASCPDDCTGTIPNGQSCTTNIACQSGVCKNSVCIPDADGDGVSDDVEGTYLQPDGTPASCVNPDFAHVFESVTYFSSPAPPAAVYTNDNADFTFLGCLKGDITNNGVVDGDDISPFIAEFQNQQGETSIVSRGDLNQDGEVDGDDISPFVAEFQVNNP